MIRRARARAILRKVHVRIVYALIVTLAGGAYALATTASIGPSARFKVIIGIIIIQTAAILMLIHKLFDLLITLRSTHRASSYVNTIRGLWATLEIGVEQGGLTPEVRQAIYRAGDEQFALYDREMNDGPARWL